MPAELACLHAIHLDTSVSYLILPFIHIFHLKQGIVAYDTPTFENDGISQPIERDHRNESIYSKRVKAGKRRTYFFDVRATRGNDYFITITESKKRFDDGGYDRHKMFLYKEDFNKFLIGLTDTIDYVKTDLMPNFDFDAFSHDNDEEYTPAAHRTPEPVAVLDTPIELMEHTTDSGNIEDWKM